MFTLRGSAPLGTLLRGAAENAADAAVEGGSQPAVGPHAVVGKVAGAAMDEEHRADGQTLDQIHRAVPLGGSFSVHENTSVILWASFSS